MKLELIDDHTCFACGSLNEKGLQIRWKVEGKTTLAEMIPQKEHQGWKGIVHGGILATLLDEAMTRLAWLVGGGALTAEMTIRYLKIAKIGEKLTIAGNVVDENRKILRMESWVFQNSPSQRPPLNLPLELSHLKMNTLIATAKGKAVKIS